MRTMKLGLLALLLATGAASAAPVTKGFVVSATAEGTRVTFVTEDGAVTVSQGRFVYGDSVVSAEELVARVAAETAPVKVWVRGGVAEVYAYRTLPHAPARGKTR